MVTLPLGLQRTAADRYGAHFVKKLKKLEKESLSRVVERLIIHEEYTQKKADDTRKEFLQFFSLFFATNSRVNFATLADHFLHNFLLFTRDYDRFCWKHFGRFINHNPVDSKNPPDKKAQARTIKLFEELYGINLVASGRLSIRPDCNEGGTAGCNDRGTGSIIG
jgi:hypothetical protein